jgi:hypothetical protein
MGGLVVHLCVHGLTLAVVWLSAAFCSIRSDFFANHDTPTAPRRERVQSGQNGHVCALGPHVSRGGAITRDATMHEMRFWGGALAARVAEEAPKPSSTAAATAHECLASFVTKCKSLTRLRTAPQARNESSLGAWRRACGAAEEAPKHAHPSSATAARPHGCTLLLRRARSCSGLTLTRAAPSVKRAQFPYLGLGGALAAPRWRSPCMPCHQPRLQHRRTSACFASDELPKLKGRFLSRPDISRLESEMRVHAKTL